MIDDDYAIEDEMMDDYYLGTVEPEPEQVDFSYDDGKPDPQTGLTPMQQAYRDYLHALEVYIQNWAGVPWYARTEEPPRWADFWLS